MVICFGCKPYDQHRWHVVLADGCGLLQQSFQSKRRVNNHAGQVQNAYQDHRISYGMANNAASDQLLRGARTPHAALV